MPNVTQTLKGRYVDVEKLSALLRRLFGDNFSIRVSHCGFMTIFNISLIDVTSRKETTMSKSLYQDISQT